MLGGGVWQQQGYKTEADRQFWKLWKIQGTEWTESHCNSQKGFSLKHGVINTGNSYQERCWEFSRFQNEGSYMRQGIFQHNAYKWHLMASVSWLPTGWKNLSCEKFILQESRAHLFAACFSDTAPSGNADSLWQVCLISRSALQLPSHRWYTSQSRQRQR